MLTCTKKVHRHVEPEGASQLAMGVRHLVHKAGNTDNEKCMAGISEERRACAGFSAISSKPASRQVRRAIFRLSMCYVDLVDN